MTALIAVASFLGLTLAMGFLVAAIDRRDEGEVAADTDGF